MAARHANASTATRRGHTILMVAALAARAVAGFHLAAWAVLAWGEPGMGRKGVLLGVFAAAQLIAGAGVITSHRGVPPWWAAWEMVPASLLLILGADVAEGLVDPWRFIVPYTVATAITVGLSAQPWRVALALQSIPTLAYVASALALRPQSVSNIPQNLVTYIGAVLAAHLVCQEILRSADQLDRAKLRDIAQRTQLAAAAEREWFLRELHDHELQTLETLARERFVPDATMRALVAQHAHRLRALVNGEGTIDRTNASLSDVISEVVDTQRVLGLDVEVTMTPEASIAHADPVGTNALAGALHEALTNVRKHAGVTQAAVHVTRTHDGTMVEVLDEGRGLGPEGGRPGHGIRRSIVERMSEAGGHASVSNRRRGTRVELVLPLAVEERVGRDRVLGGAR